MKTFLRGEEPKRLSLRPRKRTWEISVVFSLSGFYIYRLVNVKVIKTRVTKFKKVVKHCSQACSCIVLIFYTALGASLGSSPYWDRRLLRCFSFYWLFTSLETQLGFSWQVLEMCFVIRPQGPASACLAVRSDSEFIWLMAACLLRVAKLA